MKSDPFSLTRAKALGSEQFVLITKKCLVQNSHSTNLFVVPVCTPQLLFFTLNQKIYVGAEPEDDSEETPRDGEPEGNLGRGGGESEGGRGGLSVTSRMGKSTSH